ncbi:pentapeptide repeat-containing protein [Pantanalinema rosaneae CENA516]|uniref:pentapeptide repeat-containing protein n=1 Tax=Pantanalinema rosaneae TaxID=1620701 RepID=UPI003D6E5CD0
MPNLRSLNFVNQDLRNRSFRQKALNGADFRGADIRGCDFSQAQLVGANFTHAKMGQSRQQIVRLLILIAIVAGVMAHTVSQLIFGALGQVPGGSAWGFILALYMSLGIAGGMSGMSIILKPRSRANRSALWLAGVASSTLVGFFYGGSLTGNNAMLAIGGAVGWGSLTAIGLLRYRTVAIAAIVTTAGAVAAYGFAFLVYAHALTWWQIQQTGLGGLLMILALFYLWLTLNALVVTYHQIRQAPGTVFRGANLTHTRFEAVQFSNTDFEGALRLED